MPNVTWEQFYDMKHELETLQSQLAKVANTVNVMIDKINDTVYDHEASEF